MDAAHAKAQETRRRHKEARDQQFRERLEDEKIDRPATLEALRKIRDDDRSTPEQRLFAILVIDDLQSYHFVPIRLKYADAGKVDLSAFEKEVEAIQASQEQTPT